MVKLLKTLLFIIGFNMLNAQNNLIIEWEQAATFKDFPENLGLAGMMVAKTKDGFLIAGGANFPDALPWEGGSKFFSDKIFFWNGKSEHPEVLKQKLPEGIAYAGYTTYNNQLIIVGGETKSGASNKVYKIIDTKTEELPNLPTGLMAPSVILDKDNLYVFGGDTSTKTNNQVLVLNLKQAKNGWKSLPDLPINTANAASFLINDEIYVASGRSKNSNGISTLNNEIFKFNLKNQTWQKETNVQIDEKITPFVASAFFSFKNRYLVFAGGDDGKTFNKIETFLSKISQEKNEQTKQILIKEKNYLAKHHQGFNNTVLIYDTLSKKWLGNQHLPFQAHVTTASVADDNIIYIFSGEIRPGVRSPKIWKGVIKF